MHDEEVRVREVLRKAEGVDSSLSAEPRELAPTPSLFADSLFFRAFILQKQNRLFRMPDQAAPFGSRRYGDLR